MLEILYAERGWITAAKLLVKAGWDVNESNKRMLRELANLSQGMIVSGQQGYCHFRHATLDELDHAANWLTHQAVEMDKRARAIRRLKNKYNPQK